MEKKDSAISAFIDLLSFVKENIGDTADYPIRVTDDYSIASFSEKLDICLIKVAEAENKNSEHYELDPIF
jgi:hypothetical protein